MCALHSVHHSIWTVLEAVFFRARATFRIGHDLLWFISSIVVLIVDCKSCCCARFESNTFSLRCTHTHTHSIPFMRYVFRFIFFSLSSKHVSSKTYINCRIEDEKFHLHFYLYNFVCARTSPTSSCYYLYSVYTVQVHTVLRLHSCAHVR